MEVMATGTSVTTSPLEFQTSDCDQLSDGRQSGSVSTSASLHVVWKSLYTCCVFSLGNCLWVVLQFLYLPVPANHVNIEKTNKQKNPPSLHLASKWCNAFSKIMLSNMIESHMLLYMQLNYICMHLSLKLIKIT